jgi:hypothetical protein
VLLYGDAQYSVKICNDNGLTITDNIEGLTLTYDDKIKANVVTAAIRQQNTPKQPDNNYFIKQTQSVYDLALMFGYGLDSVVNFCNLSGLDITAQNVGGQNISVTKLRNALPENIIFATASEFEIIINYLLQEDDFYLLQEDGSKIEL